MFPPLRVHHLRWPGIRPFAQQSLCALPCGRFGSTWLCCLHMLHLVAPRCAQFGLGACRAPVRRVALPAVALPAARVLPGCCFAAVVSSAVCSPVSPPSLAPQRMCVCLLLRRVCVRACRCGGGCRLGPLSPGRRDVPCSAVVLVVPVSGWCICCTVLLIRCAPLGFGCAPCIVRGAAFACCGCPPALAPRRCSPRSCDYFRGLLLC